MVKLASGKTLHVRKLDPFNVHMQTFFESLKIPPTLQRISGSTRVTTALPEAHARAWPVHHNIDNFIETLKCLRTPMVVVGPPLQCHHSQSSDNRDSRNQLKRNHSQSSRSRSRYLDHTHNIGVHACSRHHMCNDCILHTDRFPDEVHRSPAGIDLLLVLLRWVGPALQCHRYQSSRSRSRCRFARLGTQSNLLHTLSNHHKQCHHSHRTP